VSWFFYLRLKRERQESKQKLMLERSNRIATNAQLKAIRAQMNPHFIFNAINSIQYLVLQNEKLKSYDYLESFSSLVRMTLDYSEREFITLGEEISFLELYLQLESLRFEENFQFELTSDEGIQACTIPSLVVQPFVENAIKHGLLHKMGEKKLTIKFTKLEENRLKCIVIDNGVGRDQVRKIMKRRGNKHTSFSMNAIKNRMLMLSEQLDIESRYEIEDLHDENGQPQGTKVIIYLVIVDPSMTS
jgi:LytS/YehU family sensor histidine kinase